MIPRFQKAPDAEASRPLSERVPADGADPSIVQINKILVTDAAQFNHTPGSESFVDVSAPESDSRYRKVLDSMDQAFCVIEMLFDEIGNPTDYRFLEVNPQFSEQTGLVGALGKRIRELVPHHEQHWFDTYGRVALTGEAIRFENSSTAMNRWFSVYAFRDGGPESRKVAVFFSDVTAKKRTEFLGMLSQKLSGARTEAEIISVTVEAVGRHLNVDRCYFVECLEKQNLVLVSHNYLSGKARTLEGRYDLFDFGGIEWWRSYSTGNFAVDDVETNPLIREKAANYLALGVRAYAVQPFRRDGEWTVILGVTQSVPRKWTAESLRLIDDVVARVWPLVQQARVDRELHESEAFLQSIIGATADCIKVLNLDGEIQWVSENGRRLLEIQDFSQVKNRVWSDCFADPATGRLAREAVQMARNGGIGRFRGQCLTFGGNLKWWDVIVSPIKGADGRPIQILSVARDVTAVREVEEALRDSQEALEQHAQTLEARLEELRIAKAESESAARNVAESAERLRLLSEVVSLQVWTASADGEVDYANQEAVSYMGADFDEIRGEGWARFVHPEDLPEARACWRRSLATGEHYETKFRLRNHAGTYRWFLVRAEALRDSDGRVIKWFGSNTDIDELKSAQEAAERANRSKDDFLAALSHELRTPLTPVLMTAASLYDDERLPADVREQLGMIERNIELEARLIDDLLDLTAVSHGKLQLRAERCDAHALINLAIEIVREEAVSKKIRIERAFEATDVRLVADRARFQQVLWNLLRNSVKFTPERGNIVVSTQNEIRNDGTSWLRIEVSDTGIGIDPSRLEQIFRPFEQGDLKGGHRFGGLGLGLAIARAVVDLHGGTIKAESRGPGSGARFIVHLPSASTRTIGVPVPMRKGGTVSASEELGRASVTRAAPLRLLLVEDDHSSLETFSRLLRRDGHEVVPVSTVADALAAAENATFDLVISDIGLPDGTGIELMEQLRQLHGLRGVALSGYGMEEDVARTRQAGFVTHLTKPIQIAELRRVLVAVG